MIDIVGIDYDVLKSFNTIPIEIANLIDILSINKSYILQSEKFNETFLTLLSDNNVIQTYAYDNDEVPALSTELLSADSVHVKNEYINENTYRTFLVTL